MNTIDVGKEFYHRLANRNKSQGDGEHTAEEFREKYLKFLDNENAWTINTESIVLNFKNVKKIGPSFANEAFAYFTKYAKEEQIFMKIKIEEASIVQMEIIRLEIKAGYNTK